MTSSKLEALALALAIATVLLIMTSGLTENGNPIFRPQLLLVY